MLIATPFLEINLRWEIQIRRSNRNCLLILYRPLIGFTVEVTKQQLLTITRKNMADQHRLGPSTLARHHLPNNIFRRKVTTKQMDNKLRGWTLPKNPPAKSLTLLVARRMIRKNPSSNPFIPRLIQA